jgi:integrase
VARRKEGRAIPRLKGLLKRGRAYFYRERAGGTDRLVNLGRDFDLAVKRLLALRRGEQLPGTELTVKEAADRWLEVQVKVSRNEKGHKLSADRVKQYLVPFMGHMRLDRVSTSTLMSYKAWLPKQGLRKVKGVRKPLGLQSQAHVLSDCRAMMNFCVDSGLLDRSPVPRRWLPRIPERPPDRFTPEERKALVSLPEPLGFVLRFLLSTGLRWGEMVRAQASDITDGVLLVRQSKSGRVRRVPLPQSILVEVKHRVGRLSPFTLSGNFATQVRRISNVQRFHCHMTRHEFACSWLEAGGSLEALRQILGHSTVRTTERYGRISDDMVLREARRVEAFQNGDKNGDKTARAPLEAAVG